MTAISQKTKHAENIFYIKQTYKLLQKEFKFWPQSSCKDKNYQFNCYSCNVQRFMNSFKALIDDLEDFYKWEDK